VRYTKCYESERRLFAFKRQLGPAIERDKTKLFDLQARVNQLTAKLVRRAGHPAPREVPTLRRGLTRRACRAVPCAQTDPNPALKPVHQHMEDVAQQAILDQVEPNCRVCDLRAPLTGVLL
jgi:hypothetical protein